MTRKNGAGMNVSGGHESADYKFQMRLPTFGNHDASG